MRQLSTLRIDTAKQVFQLHRVDHQGHVWPASSVPRRSWGERSVTPLPLSAVMVRIPHQEYAPSAVATGCPTYRARLGPTAASP